MGRTQAVSGYLKKMTARQLLALAEQQARRSRARYSVRAVLAYETTMEELLSRVVVKRGG